MDWKIMQNLTQRLIINQMKIYETYSKRNYSIRNVKYKFVYV